MDASAPGYSRVSPEGPSDTNGSDRINVHVSGRFLRALRFPGATSRLPAPTDAPRIIRAVAPLLALLGIGALVAAAVTLRSFGPGFRVGRLLASLPPTPMAEARALAERGERRYIRVDGRLDAEEEFEDDAHRPLVLRRTRLEARRLGRWVPFEEQREAVAFEVREGIEGLAIDGDALDEGLVVMPRESTGTAGELGDRAPAGMSARTPVRLRIDQLSSVEHAIVLGVPVRAPDGTLRMTAGLGRPLVVSTLEPPEAMRVLADGGSRPRVAAGLLVAAAVLLALAAVVAVTQPSTALAASPAPSAASGGDPRSPGEGPGLVGDPLLAIVGVLGLGVASVAGTLAWLRLTARRDGTRR